MARDVINVFSEKWEPVAQIGDFVRLLRDVAERPIMRVEAIEAVPILSPIDFGAVNAGVATAPTAAQLNGQDIFEVGPEEWVQVRMQLSTGFDAAGLVFLETFQPGQAQSRWTLQNTRGHWNLPAQNFWTSLHPTQIFSWYNQTPQFSVTNGTVGAIGSSVVNFFAFRYLGFEVKGDSDRRAPAGGLDPSEVSMTPSGVLLDIPVGPRFGPTSRVG